MFYLKTNLYFGIPPVQYWYSSRGLLTGLTAQQKGTTVRWYSNKTSLQDII